nr:FAD/NAD(P)-binding protein [Pseudoroseomonas vastitatis]
MRRPSCARRPCSSGYFEVSEWLAARPDAPAMALGFLVFAPRQLYGRYLAEQFRAAKGPMLRHLPHSVSRPQRQSSGFLLEAGGRQHRVDRVALAVGGFAAPDEAPRPVFSNP